MRWLKDKRVVRALLTLVAVLAIISSASAVRTRDKNRTTVPVVVPSRRVPCFRGPCDAGPARLDGIGPRKHVFAMESSMPHRKRCKTYNIPGDAHELTFSCFHRLPLLGRDRTRRWFLEALDQARQRHDFALWAYVIMPEHVHIILWPRQPSYEIRLLRTAVKVPVQRKALAFLRQQAPDFLQRLRDEQPNGDVHYRFWQRGGGYDRNIHDPGTLRTMMEYIHNNPVRRGLVRDPIDWPWSSARFYAGMTDALLRMDAIAEFVGG
jgi:putative transposase